MTGIQRKTMPNGRGKKVKKLYKEKINFRIFLVGVTP
jgi:hypothetical protein